MAHPGSGKRATEAWRAANLFDQGMGPVVVARFKGSGEVEMGVFLVDVFCLGVKNAFFTRLAGVEYEDTLQRVFAEGDAPVATTPECARRLVEAAVAYAGRLGFPPHEDYKVGCRVFGGIDAAACRETFHFGKDGKPFYIQGPNDSPRFAQHVLRSLDDICGEGNYDYLVLA